MAKAATDEQIQLRKRARRRLIGALALVTLIAVVLPWVLESEPKPSDQEISIQIPSSSGSSAFTSRLVPGSSQESLKTKPDTSKPPAVEGGVGADSEGPQTSETKAASVPALSNGTAKERKPKPAKESKSPATDTKNASESRESTTAEGSRFVVQIAALNDAAKASAMQKALAAKGLKSYTEVVKTTSGDVTRVRVGPFPNRASAEREQTKLKALGFNGNVVPR